MPPRPAPGLAGAVVTTFNVGRFAALNGVINVAGILHRRRARPGLGRRPHLLAAR